MRRLYHRMFAACALALPLLCCAPPGSEPEPGQEPLPSAKADDPVAALVSRGNRLPCRAGEPCRTGQGPGGLATHYCRHLHATDFLSMPIGTPIPAMRSGRIGLIVEEHADHEGTCFGSCYHKTNLLVVHHDDGTESAYWHLTQSFARTLGLAVGDEVRRGEVVALSGNTGYSDGPHLHVHATPCCSTSWDEHRLKFTVPMLFAEAGDAAPAGYRYYYSQNWLPGDEGDHAAEHSVTVDEEEAEVAGIAGALHEQASATAYHGRFLHATPAPADSPTATVRYRPQIRRTGLYWVEPFLPPTSLLYSRRAPYVVHAAGETVELLLYQEYKGGTFYPLGEGRRFKLIAGDAAFVDQHNGNGDPLWRTIIYDAIRFTYLGPPGSTPADAACTSSTECAGELVCRGGICGEEPDAGPPDAGPTDAGPMHTALPDAAPPGAGPTDAGPPDAGPTDAGPTDAASTDAG